ncbi:MAG: CRISPR-associated endonuclease Cas1 [candidate division Zixibacteria bacterium HGW-Zixibacteria-1]|nr:MAG: CRISPR-associated endonuclease Cas1 [candidate division Zixibacteria bacterium HGW-Zixibacteria-1]
MSVLYVVEQGAVLRKTGKRIIVEKDGSQLAEVEVNRLEAVLIYGNIQFTTQVARLLLENGIEMALLSESGKLYGQLTPPMGKNVHLRQNQYLMLADGQILLNQAKLLVKTKIENSREVLKQFSYNNRQLVLSAETAELSRFYGLVDAAGSLSELNGIEGSAARVYFGGFGKSLKTTSGFAGRTKRPPRDPVNALLSFGYVLLNSIIQSSLDGCGFDPYLGIYHKIYYGRPSLALDLLEIFRAPVVDRFVNRVFNLGIFKNEDFQMTVQEGCRLNNQALKKFFINWEKYLTRIEFRDSLEKQINSLRYYFMNRTAFPEYYLFKAG